MIVRLALVIVAAALLGVQIVRNAAVGMFAERKPAEAARFWPSHPSVEISLGMTRIAEGARQRRLAPASVFASIDDGARKDPLAPEPFLVAGVQAQLKGDTKRAEQAFEEAQWRDPRSLAAAYFLADRYFREGQATKGLGEIAALGRLAPNGAVTLAPYLAAYARDPANWPAIRNLFRANPRLAEVTLTNLAVNPATVPAVLALAGPREPSTNSTWLAPLLKTLTNSGHYAKARQVWAQAAGAQSVELIHDAAFRDATAPPPFNWALTSSAVGLAERQPGGRLHLVFYGQDDGVLAAEMLLLQPGTYHLSMRLLGDPARARTLTWSLWCDKAPTPIAGVTLDAVAARGWQFQVPPGCAAQWLKLSGSSTDIPQQVDVTIADLKLERIPAGA